MSGGSDLATPAPLIIGEGWFRDSRGGLARSVQLLHAELQRSHDVHTLVVGPMHEEVEGVQAVSTARAPLLRRLLAVTLEARALAGQADVVDAHFALYAFLPLVTRSLRGRPLVVHFHGPWAAESRAAGDTSRVRPAAKQALERFVYRRAGELVVHSSAFKRTLVEEYGVQPWHVHVLPPAVDVETFTPGDRRAARERLELPRDAKVVACVRRLVPRMGVDVLIDACATLAPATRERLVLVVAGVGPEHARLEQRASELQLDARFLGGVGDEELVDVYRAADVSVVPSVALEGFGLVVLEALACGTPVVVTDVGGLPEGVAALDESLIVPPRDPEALARRLEQALAASPDLPDPERCRRHAEAFSRGRAVRRHVAIYRRALATRERRTRPRIVYLGHCAQLSGGELALLRLLKHLRCRVDAHVVVAEDGPLLGQLARAGISAEVVALAPAARGTRRHEVRLGRPPVLSTAVATAHVLSLARRLRRLRPDLVHANSLKALVYGGLAGRLAGVPVVWHVRDRIADDYLPPFAVRLVGSLARLIPDAVIANSYETLRALERANPKGLGSIPCRVVYDPVDFRPDRASRSRGPLRVGMLGRIAPWKGQHVFLDAFARAFPAGSEEAVVIGAPLFGEDGYEQELRQRALDLGVARRVRFSGFRPDVGRELAGLDVLVHASLLPEPLGQVVQEGMRAGLPVVASRAGGPTELIRHGATGFLFTPGDAEELATMLARLGGDAELRARVGAAASADSERFDPERAAAEVGALYEEVLAA